MSRHLYDHPMLTGPHGNPNYGGINSDFNCVHCRAYVTANPLVCGVHNRNHCPFCLWSRHMDLYAAGDRLSACRGAMRPIGLTLKQSRKKYGANQGELMLIHGCSDCGAVSINRIAADDDNDAIYRLFEASFNLDAQARAWLDASPVKLLAPADAWLVERRLWGGRLPA
ncbi:MAG TPA: RNHCP domain-containing protein [Anaerolineaceae bacterium]|nr:RNHCP domain-containing protein [Anaerolineaceae bacterium]HPN51858.1 RNHCP domain-containing protein [Anaerolineaceae bacterium]